ncbi:MAG: 16S rRNA (guanine(527)-N(7))-methyltransferase RsmG [Bacteroidia bacterium]|nr:16S rRNA (guanine(527)-N(7))-methyltransferase RsmG [Bacteroidia bacterium]
MEQLKHLFPDISDEQIAQFAQAEVLYNEWNSKINVISRKDIDQFQTRHLLHSLSIALFTSFKPGSKVLDVGTGGGFPGVPLAILYPNCTFHLVDSIGKKIKVVNEVASALGLNNITADHIRAEQVKGTYDYVVSRAVTRLTPFFHWIHDKIDYSRFTNSGFYGLKGGDLAEEVREFQNAYKKSNVTLYSISDKLSDAFFETKKIVFVN